MEENEKIKKRGVTKLRKEFSTLKRAVKGLYDSQYPGYPFSVYGVLDFKTRDCWISSSKNNFVVSKNWKNFNDKFAKNFLFNILGSYEASKGSFITEKYMRNYRVFLDNKFDETFYFDHEGLVRLYFAVYSAILEYKDSDKVMMFMYDSDCDYTGVELFNSLYDIKEYINIYIKGEDYDTKNI